MAAVFGVGDSSDYRRACFFAAASGSTDAWRLLLPAAAGISWHAQGDGAMDLHYARLCWPALWAAAAGGHESLSLVIVDELRRRSGFRRPLPLAESLLFAPAARHREVGGGKGVAEEGVKERGRNDWVHEWDAMECAVPLIWMVGDSNGVQPSGGVADMADAHRCGGAASGAVEGLLRLSFARGLRRLAERLMLEAGEVVAGLSEERAAVLVSCALGAGCLGAVSVWADLGLPHRLEKTLGGVCGHWRSLLRARRSSSVIGVAEVG